MVKTKLLLCFVLAIATARIVECRGRGGGHSSHSSHSSHGSHSHGSHSSGHSGGGFFSGWGWGKSSSSSHTYPKSSGHSGHGSGGSHTYPASHGYSGSGHSGATRHVSNIPTYYSSPQHVYVTQYRNSDSRYSDLLTGLTMYNLGRSHGHYHHHYYSDNYYRTSTNTRDTNTVEEPPKEEATCFLRIKKNNKEEVLKIPCAIVSTFDSGVPEIQDLGNKVKSNNCSSASNATLDNRLSVNGTNLNVTNLNVTSANMTAVCNGTVDVEDPLAVKGATINAEDMECIVEIQTQIARVPKLKVIRNNVDCKVLLQQAKMPVPENKNSHFLPSRPKLKAMLDNPPWWFSLFFAV